MTRLSVPRSILNHTFSRFRKCGRGTRECQVLWTSSWRSPHSIDDIVHPAHRSHVAGFAVEDRWLTEFWLELASADRGVRVQVHTHPGAAFHSAIDDEYPIVHSKGFLSLVVPNFAFGRVGFEGAYLTEIAPDGSWQEVAITSKLDII